VAEVLGYLSITDTDPASLDKQVNEKIAEGWAVWGAPVIIPSRSPTHYAEILQAMVLHDKKARLTPAQIKAIARKVS
jgi:hypothetical protein